jgi:heme-degrading monooxygenase HmoA
MKSKSQLLQFYVLPLFVTLLVGCGKSSVNAQYNIASQEYEQLTEKYLQHVANFEWEDSYAFLANDIEFKLPDGDTDSRTVFKGIENVKDFWNNYVKNSGNDRTSFKDFVHIPVEVNEENELIGATGVFNLCYFSAELSYDKEKAKVRMHWAFHFNGEKKIDGIYAYYDRTPIIEAANKNFLAKETSKKQNNDMVVQIIKLKSELSENELLKIAKDRASRFRAIPGLIQKYYVRLSEPGEYGGVYVWDSRESMQAYIKSDLAATIAQAYKGIGAPNVEISEVLFQLRE